MLFDLIPPPWKPGLAEHCKSETHRRLAEFIEEERASTDIFPPAEDVFTALQLTPPERVRVLILGQDPYHNHGQAHGLSFSVPEGTKLPPSLRNILKERESDLGMPPATVGDLTNWARQGVLLLNTVLTVRAHEANSHQKRGWEAFTDEVISIVNQQENVAFVLWGKPAQKKAKLVDADRHLLIESAHPSPLSARRGFIGSRPFSRINEYLVSQGQSPIDWSLPGDSRADDSGGE